MKWYKKLFKKRVRDMNQSKKIWGYYYYRLFCELFVSINSSEYSEKIIYLERWDSLIGDLYWNSRKNLRKEFES